jgi:hypothetical protein
MEYRYGAKPNFFKLYFGSRKILPPSRIYLYYKGRPLYCPAMFEKDRYAFALPKNLEEKMLTGDLIADFDYKDAPRGAFLDGSRVKIPASITLSDRYA